MPDKRWDRMAATQPPEPYGWIQWKGTNVCMDVHCSCGAHGHIDDEFAYQYKCLACGKMFDIAGYVRLVEVPPSEVGADDEDRATRDKDLENAS